MCLHDMKLFDRSFILLTLGLAISVLIIVPAAHSLQDYSVYGYRLPGQYNIAKGYRIHRIYQLDIVNIYSYNINY